MVQRHRLNVPAIHGIRKVLRREIPYQWKFKNLPCAVVGQAFLDMERNGNKELCFRNISDGSKIVFVMHKEKV